MSRLLKHSEEYRTKLESRNLYTPTNEYELNSNEMLKSISSILPYINVTGVNKILRPMEKLYDRIHNRTPIIEIGMRVLADQFLMNVTNNVSRNIAEVTDFSHIIRNKKLSSVYTGLNYKITKIKPENTFQKIGNIIEATVGTSPINKLELNIRDKSSRESILLENTGTGQLNQLMSNINTNKYKLPSIINDDTINKNKYIDNSDRYNSKLLFTDKDTFSTLDDTNIDEFKENPIKHNVYNPSNNISNESGNNSIYSRSEFVKSLGNTKSNLTNEIGQLNDRELIYTNYGFRNDEDDLIWGYNDDEYASDKYGMLYYTSKLLKLDSNIDLTQKVRRDSSTKNVLSYNGSGLYEIPEESKSYNDRLVDGIRQHVFKYKNEDGEFEDSQYNKYAKLIRFNGNEKYNGNENSVIYNSVIPKIAPTFDDTSTKNLMFTLENLAVRVKDKDYDNSVCYLEDDTMLPLSEAGSNNGRIMWFAPYNVQYREDVRVDRTSTPFIGRGEHVYTYNNSERTGVLDFKMIIDTPPQLRNISQRDGESFHKKASQFFDFGGFAENAFSDTSIKDIEDRINKIKEKLEKLVQHINISDNNITTNPSKIIIYFDNDEYEFPYDYETTDSLHLNSRKDREYNIDYFVGTLLDKIILEYFTEETEYYYDVNLVGNASNLYLANGGDKYNEELSKKRCVSIENYIRDSYKTIYKKDLGDKYKFNIIPMGSKNADEPNLEDLKDTESVKLERNVEFTFKRNTRQKTIENHLTDDEKEERQSLLEELERLESELNRIKSQHKNDNNRFNKITIDDEFAIGFGGTEKQYFQNTFFSQTPEAFHRRLTFLHQCTRQGRNIDGNTHSNSVFGRQPVCIFRYGDFIHSTILIQDINFDFSTDNIWDLNPEGMGLQPMMVDISMRFIIIGGQSMRTPISKLQNALSTNFYANSTFYNNALYKTANEEEVAELKRRNRL